jgi:23S rRNA (guanosine2251-2'-O)-methyltransferase
VPSPRPSPRPDYRRRSGGSVDGRPNRPGGSEPSHWQRPPSDSSASDLLGEDEELVAGRHPVEEAFIARRQAHRLLVVPQRRQALEKLVLHAANLRIPIVEIEGGTLTSLAGFDGHQGIALVTDRRQFSSLEDILARAIERQEPPFVLVLDSLEDPQNFGSLLRTAEASGVHGVVYPTHRQAPLSAAAIKASAGAVEHLLLVPVEDLAEALTDLHVRGLRVIGTDAEAPLTVRQADLRGPAAIVVGSEGQGLGPAVRRRCDTVVRIPMRGRVTSLNASVAGSILLYEASSQRGGERALIEPAPDQTPATVPEPGTELEPKPETGSDSEAAPQVTVAPAEAQPKPRRRAGARKSPEKAASPAAEPDLTAESEPAAAESEPTAESEPAAAESEPTAESEPAAAESEPAAEPEPAVSQTVDEALLPGDTRVDGTPSDDRG